MPELLVPASEDRALGAGVGEYVTDVEIIEVVEIGGLGDGRALGRDEL